ncbi:DUF262 domain-containing protein [Helicobacter sp. 23-1045]
MSIAIQMIYRRESANFKKNVVRILKKYDRIAVLKFILKGANMVETCVLTLGELIDKDLGNEKFKKFSNEMQTLLKSGESSAYQLTIPFYQRAYVWSEDMVKIMLEDIDEQRKEGKNYLLGSLIVHIEGNEFNIVDGQQRLTTLDLVLKYLDSSKALFGDDDNKAGSINGREIAEKEKEENQNSQTNAKTPQTPKGKANEAIKNWFNGGDKNSFLTYLKNNIEFVCVFTDSIDDAFIFFDSANAKGKRLESYDLIKAYHLRALEDTCKDKIPHYARFFENLATRGDDLNILINRVLKLAREWIMKHKQNENIEETMKIYNEFCKEIPQRFRKDEPNPTQNSLGILQNFMGGVDFFEYLKEFDTHYKRMKDFRLYAELNGLKDKGGFDYALKLYLMSSLIYLNKFPNGKIDYMLRLIARAVFSVRISEQSLKYTITEKYGIRLLPLIYYASYEQELEYKLNDFIETELANEAKESDNTKFKKEAEYLAVMQEEYKKYGITAHIPKKSTK